MFRRQQPTLVFSSTTTHARFKGIIFRYLLIPNNHLCFSSNLFDVYVSYVLIPPMFMSLYFFLVLMWFKKFLQTCMVPEVASKKQKSKSEDFHWTGNRYGGFFLFWATCGIFLEMFMVLVLHQLIQKVLVLEDFHWAWIYS